MRARVLYRDAQGRSGDVDLTSGEPCFIGRALDCAVRTDDAMVSRKHSVIRGEAGRFYVEDLGSSNGTHVNDLKIERQVLAHNDVVRCGNLWLRYVEEAPAAPAPELVSEPPTPPPAASKFRSTLGHGGAGPPGAPRSWPLPATDSPPVAANDASAPTTEPGRAASASESIQDGTGPGPEPVAAPGAAPAVAAPRPAAPIPRPAAPAPRPHAPAPRPAAPAPRAAAPAPRPVPPGPPAVAVAVASAGASSAAATLIRPGGAPLAADQAAQSAVSGAIDDGHVPEPESPHATPISVGTKRASAPEAPMAPEVPELPELQRKLRMAVARAEEIERALVTLKAELNAAQEKINVLLSTIREVTSIETDL